MKPYKSGDKCKVCRTITLCELCDDTERQVCTFCMDLEHRRLWAERQKELANIR